MLSVIKNSVFLKSVFILSSGTVLAQAIPLLASPLLTRLYSPSDFGLLAVFMALVTSVGPIVTGQYEIAIVVPKSDSKASDLFSSGLWLGLFISTLIFIIIFFFGDEISNIVGGESLGFWIYFVPIMILFFGLLRLGNYFANRNEFYSYMAKAKFLNAVCIVLINVILGFFGFGFEGLILGNLIGIMFAIVYIYFKSGIYNTPEIFSFNKDKYSTAKEFKEYPIYSGSSSFFNGLSLALPVFFLSSYYDASIVGFYAIVNRVLYSPLSFISVSISQVNLKKVTSLIHQNTPILPYLNKLTLGLFSLVAIPMLIIWLYAPSIFSFIFGEEWREAGVFAQILCPAVIIKFVASTLSSTLGATQSNKLLGFWRLLAFTMTLLVLMIFTSEVDIRTLLQYLVAMDIFLYFLYLVFIYYSAKKAYKVQNNSIG